MKRIFWFCLSMCMAVVVSAQGNTCPPIVFDSIVQTNDVCNSTGRNQVCYGSVAIDVEAQTGADIVFVQPGDLSAVADIQSIETSPLDAGNDEFGIALMQVQADVPGSLPGQVVTFLLMGDVSLSNISPDGQAPMQAFQFRTGIGAPSCEDVSYDSLVIDSPDGLTVNFNVNGIDVELASTAILVGQPDNRLDMLVVEGEGRVTANGETVTVTAGNWTQIPMDETGTEAAGAPEEPSPFEPERIAHIPFDLLSNGQNVALGKPVTADAFLETDPPENVVNGRATGADNWNAGDLPLPHWIEIDLLRPYAVSQIRMLTSQYPPEQYDPTVHSILVRGEGETDYHEVHVFSEETRDDQWLEFIPDTPVPDVRYVRVLTTSSIHWTSWGEIEVYSAGFAGCIVTANSATVNLRADAGTGFSITGTMNAGDRAVASAYTDAEDGFRWWQINANSWVREDLVSETGVCGRLPSV